MKRRLEAGFVLRVTQTHDTLKVIIYDLRSHQKLEFSSWEEAHVFLKQQPKAPSLT